MSIDDTVSHIDLYLYLDHCLDLDAIIMLMLVLLLLMGMLVLQMTILVLLGHFPDFSSLMIFF